MSIDDSGQSASRAMVAAVRALFAAVSVADGGSVRRLLADGAIMELPFATPPFPRSSVGADRIAAGIGRSGELLRDFSLTPTNFYPSPESDSIVIEAISSGTLVRGGRYSNQYVFIFTFSEGKISLWREYFNPLRLPQTI